MADVPVDATAADDLVVKPEDVAAFQKAMFDQPLLDSFAAGAIGLAFSLTPDTEPLEKRLPSAAAIAYEIARALLAERAKG